MQAVLLCLLFALQALPILAAERVFDFNDTAPGQLPPDFRSTVAGGGAPGDWKVLAEETSAPTSEVSTSAMPSEVRQLVLTQADRGLAPGRIPLLVYDGASYGDFNFSARFRIAGGDSTAGLVFRYQNESNFFAVGASWPDNSLRCYKVINGEWKPPFVERMEITTNAWHEMAVECTGTRMVCMLDGRPLLRIIDGLADPSGKIGFWTRGDSAAGFADAKLRYLAQETLARKLVRDAMKAYPGLVGLRICAVAPDGEKPVIIASNDESEVGRVGGSTALEVIRKGQVYYGKDGKIAEVTLPLCDRNGEPVAAVCVVLKAHLGQTQDHAVARARPVARAMQTRVQLRDDLFR